MNTEVIQNSEHEEIDRNVEESTKELFHCETQPSPKPKTGTKPIPTKKKSNSGIPLRLKTTSTKGGPRGYRPTNGTSVGPVINKNTLEVQFINNKKRLLQMHAELKEKQRPLLEMHKSLLRTKKQLEEMGKKVVLEDLKIMSLKSEEKSNDGGGENVAIETAINLKSSIENVLEDCANVCRKFLVKRDDVVKMLESASKAELEPSEIEAEVEELKKEKVELEQIIDKTIKENEKRIEEIMNSWQKAVKLKCYNHEMAEKIAQLEETIQQQEKFVQESEDNLHVLNRKMEEKKLHYEKGFNELQDKFNKLEEELKKERRSSNEHLMKSRTMRGRLGEMELKAKDAEEKNSEISSKLKQLQEQMRKKEIQWIKEKEELKRNEAVLQQKFTEKQNQIDTRMRDLELFKMTSEMENQNVHRDYETQMEIKEQECNSLEKEKEDLAMKTKMLEEEIEEMRKQLEEKEKEVDDLSVKIDAVPAIEYKPAEDDEHLIDELVEYKKKVVETETRVEQLNEQISKMQGSLKAHAKLAAALKMEKDKAILYTKTLRETLEEARDELEFKTKTIYKIHEKLVLKDKAYDKLSAQLKAYESYAEFPGDKWDKNKCQICLTAINGEKNETSSCDTEVCSKHCPNQSQYVSDSLIGMSVKKMDLLRARVESLKKMKVPIDLKCSWSHHGCKTNLRKQVEFRGKLYQILQKHADQSCEDFINLLKMTVSNCSDKLKPSNMKDLDAPLKFGSRDVFADICNKLNDCQYSDSDDVQY